MTLRVPGVLLPSLLQNFGDRVARAKRQRGPRSLPRARVRDCRVVKKKGRALEYSRVGGVESATRPSYFGTFARQRVNLGPGLTCVGVYPSPLWVSGEVMGPKEL